MAELIIGNMTGNSMDAIDLVLTRFEADKMEDVRTWTHPYEKDMQRRMEDLRALVYQKTAEEILALAEFHALHDDYIRQIAECIRQMCQAVSLSPTQIEAVGFHGKTLDHFPPSQALGHGQKPYTLQMGSGKMLADLTGIKVVYDFRSAPVMANLEGAPLVGLHNAHIARAEGDGLYYNGGNTSNFALIRNQTECLSADAGPCNEYIDAWIRRHTDLPYDKDGKIGQTGKILPNLVQYLFDLGRAYYEQPLPKSGDPAYYHKNQIFEHIESLVAQPQDIVRTLEYFAAYVAAFALTLIPEKVALPNTIILFGGGWKNPMVRQSFEALLTTPEFVLAEHQATFERLRRRFSIKPCIRFSAFGTYMEARLFADMAHSRLLGESWLSDANGKPILCGRIAYPTHSARPYDDKINLAAKGWQTRMDDGSNA